MSTDQLKAIVIEKIMYEQNEATLQGILNLLGNENSETVTLNAEQRNSIAEGLSDYKAGRFSSASELNRQEGEWL